MVNARSLISRNQKVILIAILVVALATRLAAIFLFPVPVEKDALLYDKIAIQILKNRSFAVSDGVPTSRVAPLYPTFLSGVYLLFGHNYQAARIAQTFLSTAVCLFVYLIAKRIYGIFVGLLSAFLFAFHQSLLMITMLLTETLFSLLLVVMILFLTMAVVHKKTILFFTTGIFIALSALTKPTTLLFPVCALFVLLVVLEGRKQALVKSAVLAGATIIVITPWMVRNYSLADHVVPISSQGSSVLIGTYFQMIDKKDWRTIFDMELLEEQRQRLREVREKIREKIELENPGRVDEILRHMAIKAILDRPLEYLKVVGIRVGIFWLSPPMATYQLKAESETLSIAWMGLKYLLLFFAIFGLFHSRDKWKVILPIFGFLFYMTAVHGLLHSIRRYNLPLIPLVLIFSSEGIIATWNCVRDRGSPIKGQVKKKNTYHGKTTENQISKCILSSCLSGK